MIIAIPPSALVVTTPNEDIGEFMQVEDETTYKFDCMNHEDYMFEAASRDRLSNFINMIPKHGFKIKNNEATKIPRIYRRAKYVLKGIMLSLFNCFIEDNLSMFDDMICQVVVGTGSNDSNALLKIKLYLVTKCNSVSNICTSILFKSLSYQSVNNELSHTFEILSADSIHSQIQDFCTFWNRYQFTKYRNDFDKLVSGSLLKDIKRSYAYRVKVKQISECMQYLQE